MSSDCVRRRPRPVPRPDGAVPHRRPLARHQLPVHGRLRGPRLLQCRDRHIACCTQGRLNFVMCFVSYYLSFYT